MYKFTVAQQTSLLQLVALFFFFLRFETEELILRVRTREINPENGFNGYLFEIKDNYQSSKYENTLF